MNHLRYNHLFRFFSVAIALYGVIIILNFIFLYFPPSGAYNIPQIIRLSGIALHVISHGAVVAVVHYLGRKPMFRFLLIQLFVCLAIGVASMLVHSLYYYNLVLVLNIMTTLVYLGTLFYIHNTPFDKIFKGVALSETLLILAGYAMIFMPQPQQLKDIQNLLILGWIIPISLLFLLVHKTRRHLEESKLQAGFLEELQA